MAFWTALLKFLTVLVPFMRRKRDCLLIVEDSSLDAELLGEMIHDIGFTFDVATSCEQALGLLQNGCYPVIFIDCRMPGMGGSAFYALVRKHHPESHIVVTPTLAEDLKKLPSGEYISYIRKPMAAGAVERAIMGRRH